MTLDYHAEPKRHWPWGKLGLVSIMMAIPLLTIGQHKLVEFWRRGTTAALWMNLCAVLTVVMIVALAKLAAWHTPGITARIVRAMCVIVASSILGCAAAYLAMCAQYLMFLTLGSNNQDTVTALRIASVWGFTAVVGFLIGATGFLIREPRRWRALTGMLLNAGAAIAASGIWMLAAK